MLHNYSICVNIIVCSEISTYITEDMHFDLWQNFMHVTIFFLTVSYCLYKVLEETGFDIRPLIDPQAFIEYRMNEQLNRLYIVPGISMETEFEPRTRNEIKVIRHAKFFWLKSVFFI